MPLKLGNETYAHSY